SLPLSQVLVGWPAAGTLLVQTKVAANVPGMVFSVDIPSGTVTPLVYAQGLTATADPAFKYILYEVNSNSTPNTYMHIVQSGQNVALPFNLIPEKCIWDTATSSMAYCAVPTNNVDSTYLDALHLGILNNTDEIVNFDIRNQAGIIVADP